MMKGKALIFSAPSGSGKTTIVQHLIKTLPQLAFSISATTRPSRGNEVDGQDYYFLSLEEFKKRTFIESEEVYTGIFYGTLESEIERIWAAGKAVIFDVDVKGGLNLKQYFGDQALSVFVKAPSLEVIKERLAARETDSDESLQRRFSRMEYEMTFADKFDTLLLNEQLEESLKEAEQMVRQFLNSED